MGRILLVADRETRIIGEASVRRHEQGRRERIRLDNGESGESLVYLCRQSGDSPRRICEARFVGEERRGVAKRLRQRGFFTSAAHVADRESLSAIGWPH